MKTFKKRNSVLVIILAVVLQVLLCCNLPSILFWSLCLNQDIFRPLNTKILISACNKDRVDVTVTPDGKALFVTKASPDSWYRLEDVYLVDLSTNEKRDVSVENLDLMRRGKLLSSDLFWRWASPDYIIDLRDGHSYDLINLNQLPRLEGNKFDPKYYAYFQSAEQVFILQQHSKVIALSPDFHQNPDKNVIYFLPSGSGAFGDGKKLEKLMNDLGVKYEVVDFSYPYHYDTNLLSPTGKYIVRGDGIYLSETNALVVNRAMSDFQGWYYDESAVVLRQGGYYLIDLGSAFGSSLEFFFIPGPTIKLRLPTP